MQIAVIQNNPRIGDVDRNLTWLFELIEANAQRADLFILPELAIIGYPPRDLLSQPAVVRAEADALEKLRLLSQTKGIGILVGHLESRAKPFRGRPFYNAATLFDSGQVAGTVRKQRLPNYDIFDELRFFEEWIGESQNPIEFRGLKIAIAICEDSWDSFKAFGVRDVRGYDRNPNPFKQISAKMDLLINLSASPFSLGKSELREDLFRATSLRARTPSIYSNCAGAQDHILFDGRSFAINVSGEIVKRGKSFETDLWTVNLSELTATKGDAGDSQPTTAESQALGKTSLRNDWHDLHLSLVMGLRDFVNKNGGQKVLLGLSGGIDSALVACLAVDALGANNVTGVLLPSKFNAQASSDEALALAKNLGIQTLTIPIQDLVDVATSALAIAPHGLPYENLQSRSRGLLLMALANQTGALLLATGNKSELALGYSTLYGDMNGALLPIGDLYKTEVYGLCHYLNWQKGRAQLPPCIPFFTLTRALSAELAENQKDSDSLPAYEVLDPILYDLIENQGQTQLSAELWNKVLNGRHTIDELRRKMHAQEFKRFQAAPILRVHQRSFATGWNFPIAKGRL